MVLYTVTYPVTIDYEHINAQQLVNYIEKAQDHFRKNHNSADLDEILVEFHSGRIEFKYDVHA